LATYEWIDYQIIDYSKLCWRVEFWIINDSKAIFMNIFSPFALKKLRSWHTWLWLRWTTIIFVYAMTMYYHGHNNLQNNHEISDETNLGGVQSFQFGDDHIIDNIIRLEIIDSFSNVIDLWTTPNHVKPQEKKMVELQKSNTKTSTK